MRSDNKEYLVTTHNDWEVPFPAIWKAFMENNYLTMHCNKPLYGE